MARTRRPYRRAVPPEDIGVVSITGTIPSQQVREKRASLDTQWLVNVKRPSLRGGNYLWAKTGPRSRDGLYCITVKIYNAKPQDYWLTYSKAEMLWSDVTGLSLEDELRHDQGLPPREREPEGGELDEETTALLDEICGG